jgi:hypothetical protein
MFQIIVVSFQSCQIGLVFLKRISFHQLACFKMAGNGLQYGMKRIVSDFVSTEMKLKRTKPAPIKHFTAFCYIACYHPFKFLFSHNEIYILQLVFHHL